MRRIVVVALLSLALGCAAATDFDHYSSAGPAAPGDDDDHVPAPVDAATTETSTATAIPKVVQTGTGHLAEAVAVPADIEPSVAGNLLIIAIAIEEVAVAVDRVTDNVGNTYVSAGALSKDTDCDDRSEIWFTKDLKGGVTRVTVNLTKQAEAEVWVIEASGVSRVEAVNVLNDGPSSATVTAATVTTTAPRSLIVSTACFCEQITDTVGPFTNLPVQEGEGTAWLISDGPGSYGAVWKVNKPGTFNTSTAAFAP